MLAIQIFTCIAVAISIIAILLKLVKYATAPTHFRWELYPVPHEKGRAEYGGSYLEELNWWTKQRHSDRIKELKEMASEILFLKGVYRYNRRVWISSLPFHLGLYLCICWLALLFLGAFGFAISPSAGVVGQLVYYVTLMVGYAGLTLAGIGALGLLLWRFTDKAQRNFNSPAEYFNLLIILVIVIEALIAHLTLDPGFTWMRSYVRSFLTFSPASSPGILFSIEIVLVAFLIMYVPITRMSHFIAKYFLYHSVRWNDEPNERGSKIEKRLLKLLKAKVSWSGEHIQTGKSWNEVITETKYEKQ